MRINDVANYGYIAENVMRKENDEKQIERTKQKQKQKYA